jgi:hypothetical protein
MTTTDQLPTTADEVVAGFNAAHATYPQYEGWLEGVRWEVRRVVRPIGGPGTGTFVRAEVGDLVLVRYADYRGYLTSIPNYDSIWCPRVGWVVAGYADFHTEPLTA